MLQSETITLHNYMKAFPAFLSLAGRISPPASTIHSHTGAFFYHLTYHRTLSNMTTLPSDNGRSSLNRDPYHYGISNTRTDHNMSNTIHGHSNQNVGNISNFYKNTINVGVSEEALRIQAWLSPLEPHARHQDVRNRRLDSVGDWVLQRNEFESWSKSQDSAANPTLLCYGDQGAGKTYIRYKIIFQRPLRMLTRN